MNRACQASAADYVRSFIRRLEDPEMRLVTEKPHDWCNHGHDGKVAILKALKDGLHLQQMEDEAIRCLNKSKEGASDEQGSERPVGVLDPSILVGAAACGLLPMSHVSDPKNFYPVVDIGSWDGFVKATTAISQEELLAKMRTAWDTADLTPPIEDDPKPIIVSR